MPTYDYECQACGHRFEHFGKLHDRGMRVCPNCRKRKSKRLIGAGAGFIFKGSGFYVTDSRSSSGNGSAAKTEAKVESKSESKPSAESKPKKKSD